MLVIGHFSACQNGKRVAAPLRLFNKSLYEKCNEERNIDISSKLRKKLRIYNVKEYWSIDRNANRTIDLFQQRVKR
jgi:hypothetical protein